MGSFSALAGSISARCEARRRTNLGSLAHADPGRSRSRGRRSRRRRRPCRGTSSSCRGRSLEGLSAGSVNGVSASHATNPHARHALRKRSTTSTDGPCPLWVHCASARHRGSLETGWAGDRLVGSARLSPSATHMARPSRRVVAGRWTRSGRSGRSGRRLAAHRHRQRSRRRRRPFARASALDRCQRSAQSHFAWPRRAKRTTIDRTFNATHP